MKLVSVYWHNVDGDTVSLNATNPTVSLFREHLKFLIEHYTPISILDFLQIQQNKRLLGSYDRPPLLLGFDDGFKNVIRYARPLLEEFKVPVVFFVIGEVLRNPDFIPWYVERKYLMRKATRRELVYRNRSLNLASYQDRAKLERLVDASFKACRSEVDRRTVLADLARVLNVDPPKIADLDEDLRFVDRNDLASLSASSVLTVASHAMTHRDLATLSYREQVDELEQSDLLLREHCPSYYPVVAYPSGSFNRDTLAIANRIYKAGFATFVGSSYRNIYAYPRIGLGNDSEEDVAYAVSARRLNYILPVKRFLHVTGIRRVGVLALQDGHPR
jgi:peptidoglycan/xylan/chitin deacetylase (PgdA/CDA1 family)